LLREASLFLRDLAYEFIDTKGAADYAAFN
jgi:hypothetical protein